MLRHCFRVGKECAYARVSGSDCGGDVKHTHTHIDTHMQMFDSMPWKQAMFGPDSFSLSL